MKSSFIASKILLITLPVLIFCLIYLPFLLQKPLIIFPGNSTFGYRVTDRNDGGMSVITDEVNMPGEIGISYVLKEGYPFPYVGLGIFLSAQQDLFLTRNDSLVIEARSGRRTSLKVNLMTDVKDPAEDSTVKERGKKNGKPYIFPFLSLNEKSAGKQSGELPVGGNISKPSYSYFTSVIDVEYKYRKIVIPASDFFVPEWWLIKNKINKTESGRVYNHPLKIVEILTSSVDILESPLDFRIRYIAIKRNTVFPLYCALISSALTFIALLLFSQFYRFQKAVHEAQKTIRMHKNLDLGNEQEYQAGKLFDYMSAHYLDPYITVTQVAEDLDISVYKIPKMIYQYTSLSFKQYLNLLRIEEAKKQLIDSDSKIIDIAYALGYNSIAHFNKQFKLHASISPKEFRKRK